MSEDPVVRRLHASYRIGAAVDAAAAIAMAHPGRLWAVRFRRGFRRRGPELAYGMRTGGPLMAGWSVLLLWADRSPVERKDVLAMTMVPVIAGLMANDSAAVRRGYVSGASLLPTRALQAVLLVLFGWSWVTASAAESA